MGNLLSIFRTNITRYKFHFGLIFWIFTVKEMHPKNYSIVTIMINVCDNLSFLKIYFLYLFIENVTIKIIKQYM